MGTAEEARATRMKLARPRGSTLTLPIRLGTMLEQPHALSLQLLHKCFCVTLCFTRLSLRLCLTFTFATSVPCCCLTLLLCLATP
jgi:hypothetical protein